MRMSRSASRAAVLAVVIGGIAPGCRVPATHEPAAAIAPVSAPASEPGDCASCHADVVKRWTGSAHRLASRGIADTVQPSRARFAAGAPILEAGQGVATFREESPGSMIASDASGATEARPITHVVGGIRREDFLSPRADGLHVLPLSWSATREAWTDPTAEEQGSRVEPAGSLGWTTRLRSHATQCSRCHPAGDATTGPGITCSTCHGDAAAHVGAARAAEASGTSVARGDTRLAPLPSDAWRGCGPCHAVGSDMPRTRDASVAGPLLDLILPDTLMIAEGVNPAFALDGRPIVPHGREVQSLAQSACAREGGANCLTCHDPHGGDGTSLRDPDPDASCRACHAGIAEDSAAHARHPVMTAVPLARAEPAGPALIVKDREAAVNPKPRLPGCVDCHMPALLAFSPVDRARDHAIGVPDPGMSARIGGIDACATCHSTWPRQRLTARFGESHARARRRRAEAFEGAVRHAAGGRAGDDAARGEALQPVLDLLADAEADPWTRASAAMIVGGLGRGRSDLAPALEEAWRASEDPVLRRAVARSHALIGGSADSLSALMAGSNDWRVRIAAAAALSGAKDPRGRAELDALRHDASLPGVARSEASFELGVSLLSTGANARAEALLLEALTVAPAHAAAWVNLGVARAALGNDAGAREAWLTALEFSPYNAVARANLARMAESRQDP